MSAFAILFCFFLDCLPYVCPLFQANQGTFHFCANPVFPHLYWGCHCEQFVFLNVPCVNFSLSGKCLLQEVTLEVTPPFIQSLTAGTSWVSSTGPYFTLWRLFFTSFLKLSTPLKKPGAKHYACTLSSTSQSITAREEALNKDELKWVSRSFQKVKHLFSKCSKFFLKINFNGNLSHENHSYFYPLRVSPIDLES